MDAPPEFFRYGMKLIFFPRFVVLSVALLAVTMASAKEILVFGAASLSDALQQLATLHERATGDTVRLNLAASSTLARQVKEGAAADLFFSADEAKMDDLERAGLIEPGTRESLLGNRLVIVVPLDSTLSIASARDLTTSSIRRVALAEPQTVPAGIYAKEYLVKIGEWTRVSAKAVFTENVRAALAAVESGNAEAGIVYKTDAMISKKVKVALEIPADQGPHISYPVAVVKSGKNPHGAGQFMALLKSNEGKAVFRNFGFSLQP
ncbi:MAG: modA [Verrucomicrobia bacterium]|nr:modA [Verrucomicrobiota bacterium]